MKYALDIAVIAVLIICTAVGHRRGAVRTLIYLAGLAAAFAAAVFVSNAATGYVYEKTVRPVVVSALESKAEELESEYLSPEKTKELFSEYGIDLTDEQLEAFAENKEIYGELLTDGQFRDTLNHVFIEYCKALTEAFSGAVPEEIAKEANRYINELETENTDMEALLKGEKQSVTDIIEREIVRPVMLKTVRGVLFAATFAAVMLIASLVSWAVGIVRKIPAAASADSFFGGILGFLRGALIIVLICVGADVFIKLTSDGNGYLNSGIISETYLFKRLYSGVFMLLSLILRQN